MKRVLRGLEDFWIFHGDKVGVVLLFVGLAFTILIATGLIEADKSSSDGEACIRYSPHAEDC